MTKQTTAVIELTFAGLIWGFGFVSVVWVLEALSPSAINVLRFAVATVAGIAMALFVPAWKQNLNKEQMWVAFLP